MSALSFVTRGGGLGTQPLKFMINPWKFWGSWKKMHAPRGGWAKFVLKFIFTVIIPRKISVNPKK